MIRKLLVVANWKMDLNISQSSLYVHRLQERTRPNRSVEVVLAPSMMALQPISMQIDRRKIRLAAQNAFYKDIGPYTGEVSFSMIRELVHYCIIGHSERRIYFHEDLPMIRDKVAAAIRNEISPIVCVGENQLERKEGQTKQVLHDQVTTALSELTSAEVGDVVIAYEPVWAISTFGHQYAKPDEVAKAIAFIRYQVKELFGEKVATRLRILYGGSVDPSTVGGYLAIEGCDGALVGSASLNPYSFADIIDTCYRYQHEMNQVEI
jgi:triosephosphate isomerase